MILRVIALALVLGCIGGATASASTTYRRDPIDVPSTPGLDIVSSSRIVRTEGGTKMIRFSMRFAAGTGDVFDGTIRLDSRGDHHADAVVSYSHWDNGPGPDTCSVRAAGTTHQAKAGTSPTVNRFRCTFPRKWLLRSHPVHWRIVHRGGADRAPDHGWYA